MARSIGKVGLLLLALLATVLAGRRLPALAGDTLFKDVSWTSGAGTLHLAGYDVTGQAWADYDRDGYLDLYLTDAGGSNTLYHNEGDGTFSLSPLAASVALPDTASGGAVFADFNNDGWDDLYVLNDGPNSLFRNDGGAGFSDVTGAAGVGDDSLGFSAAWGDYDQDGWLDLYVANFPCQSCTNGDRDTLYHNNGDGTFSDVTALLPGIGEGVVEATFVASFLDYDNDGDLDIYAVYDHHAGNDLWRNDGPGCGGQCFSNVGAAAGANVPVLGMGLSSGDYDNDGDLDLFFTDGVPLGVLLQNQTSQGSPTFVDVTSAAGLDYPMAGWGNLFFDYDNDGWLDLYVAIGTSPPDQANRLFHNNGDGTFSDVSAESGASNAGNTRGVAYADYNGDGWLEMVIGNQGQSYALYQNQGTSLPGANWLGVKLRGGGPVNQDAIGSRVYLELADGRRLVQEVQSGASLGAGNDMALHFGLGYTSVQTMTVLWADGRVEGVSPPAPGQVWELAYPLAGVTLSAGVTETLSAGAAISYSHTLGNAGNRPDTFHLALESGLDQATLPVEEVTLQPGESQTVVVAATMPASGATPFITSLTATSALDPSVSATVVDVAIPRVWPLYLPWLRP